MTYLRSSTEPARLIATLTILTGMLLLAACGGDDDGSSTGSDAGTSMGADSGTGGTSDQVPPSDSSMYQQWLASGAYKSWDCDAMPTAATQGSPHGDKLICRNDIVDGAKGGSGNWPVGATLVKEQYDGAGNLGAISMETRIDDTDGKDGWHYFRIAGGDVATANVTNDAVGAPFCTGCHTTASRDFVFAP